MSFVPEANAVQRCPVCLSTSCNDVLAVRENMFGLDEDFDYSVCADCGSLALISIPDDLSPYYPTDYYSIDLDP
ncbi:MAG TPA: hypothetical protein VIJ15_10765, partial [Dermatophilaceae bacterium]